jgi:hemerythrin-like domain-containing protein
MDNEHEQGDSMTNKIEDRLAMLERQAEMNREGLNAVIDAVNDFLGLISSAIGQFKVSKIPRLNRVENVMGEEGDDK